MGNGRDEATTSEWLTSDDTKKQFITLYQGDGEKIGLYGSRRRCLFIAVAILLFLVILNLALTLWIIKATQFSSDGLGLLRLVPEGLELGNITMLDSLIATRIKSGSQGIQIEGSPNVTLSARSTTGRLMTQLTLGEDTLEVIGSSLKVSNTEGQILFSTERGETIISAESIFVTGDGGANLEGSLQTPRVKAYSAESLRFESPTKSVEVNGMFGVNILSGAGDINFYSNDDIKVKSKREIRLESANIEFEKLETVSLSSAQIPRAGANIQSTYGPHPPPKSTSRVFQMCICRGGNIFLVSPQGDCVADTEVCP